MTLHQLLLNSKEVRKLIVHRSEKYNIPLRYVCREISVDYTRFLGYINSQTSRPSDIAEHEILKALEVLGVSIRFQVVIDGRLNMIEVSKKLEETHSRDEKKETPAADS